MAAGTVPRLAGVAPLRILIPKITLPFLVFFNLLSTAVSGEPARLRSLDEPDPAREARVAWHREARFGCFIHWGVYSAPAGEWKGRKSGVYSEHLMRFLEIPLAEYREEIAKPFNPAKFDADAWVRLMRDAGMRYLVITAKHHDGFAMYPSKVSGYNLRDLTAFKRDPMAELQAACKKYGLKFGFYYSHAWDWEHPDAVGNFWDYGKPGGDSGWWEQRPDLIPKAARYIEEKSIPQVRELVDMYHPDIMWFDTSSKTPPELNRRVLDAVRAAAPDMVVNSRLVAAFGDYRSTADRPAYFPEVFTHWEAIPTTNESYGYKPSDTSHKPPGHFVQLLAMAVGKGGNILMNLGPRGDGTIDPIDAGILRDIGGWMQANGESIYGCDRTPLPVQPWGTSTRKGDTLYLHVFDWPADGKLLVSGLRSNPASVRLLQSEDQSHQFAVMRPNDDDLEISVPAMAPDAIDSVIVLDFPGQIAANKALRVSPSGDVTRLHVMDGRLDGHGIRFGDGKRTRDVTEQWSDLEGSVTWIVRLPAPGRFRVAVNYNTHTPENAGSFIVSVGGQSLRGTVQATENVTVMRTDGLGEIALPAGEFAIIVRGTELGGANLMRLRQLELTPVP